MAHCFKIETVSMSVPVQDKHFHIQPGLLYTPMKSCIS